MADEEFDFEYAILNYETILSRLERFAMEESEQLSRANISISFIHDTLPTLHGVTSQVIHGSSVYPQAYIELAIFV